MFGFSLVKLQDFNFDGHFSKEIKPGDWYFYHSGVFRAGMLIHLAGCLPAGLLMVLQFLPAIRHKYLLFHRVNGYVVLLLLLLANAGACIIIPRAAQGLLATQSSESVLVLLTTFGMIMAYWNVKRLQIDQHRAWMLRTMFYYGSIITSRPATQIAVRIVSYIGGYYSIWSCDQIDFTYRQYGITGILKEKYPQCLQPNGTVDGQVVVKAGLDMLAVDGIGANVELSFSAGVSSTPHDLAST